MKHVANIITISRILLSILLICFLNNKAIFISIYMICGISDALDVYIAGRTNTASAIGAKLDSIADFFMFGIVTIGMIIWVGAELKSIIYILWVILPIENHYFRRCLWLRLMINKEPHLYLEGMKLLSCLQTLTLKIAVKVIKQIRKSSKKRRAVAFLLIFL